MAMSHGRVTEELFAIYLIHIPLVCSVCHLIYAKAHQNDEVDITYQIFELFQALLLFLLKKIRIECLALEEL